MQPANDIIAHNYHFWAVTKFSTYRYFLMAGVLSILTACGNLREGLKPSPPASKKPKAPEIEHEALGNTKSPWVVTDEPKTRSKKKKRVVVDDNSAEKTSADLESFISEWEGTPHAMGGNTQKGVDCSGLVIQCYLQVYKKEFIGRRAEDLFSESKPIKRKDLREGDLVFFKISGRRIDHVGIYLKDGDFVHTSSSRGVMVSNLSEAYWNKRFFMGGRKS